MNLIKFITTSFAPTVLFLISSLSTQALPASYDVGMDNGSFSVSNNGQGAWIMPITAPPGPGALTPQIALQLSTSPSNGIAGQGGQLIGLSSITRCGKTIAQDGFNAAVQLSQTDGYCFDGNRLMLISGKRWPRKFGQADKWKICYHYRPTMGTTWSRKWQKEPNGSIQRHSKQKWPWQR